MHTWWAGAVRAAESITGDSPGDLDAATALFRAAGERMFPALRSHMVVTMLGQAVSDRLTDTAAAAGLPGHELRLTTGFGGMEETRLVLGLWELGRGERTMDTFLDEFGFHGPAEGELSSRSWREDPSPVRALAKKYGELPDSRHPLAVERTQTAARRQAEAELLGAVGRVRRPPIRTLLALGRAFIPDREIGKWAFLRGIDGARAAARAIGRSLAARGTLHDPDDVMFLTADELLGGLPAQLAAVVADRRRQHAEFARWTLPNTWQGMPTPTLLTDRPTDRTTITGYAASPGLVEGPARVVRDAAGCDDLLEGEILVCPTTDPAWVSAFYLASALVVDVGGPSSHAAIVARELGVPAVVGTEHGTASIHTGDRLRVDGASGTVEVLARESEQRSSP
jgi:pyruvate,water dikinase